MVLVPLIYFGQKQDTVREMVVNDELEKFSRNVSEKGYITLNMYETFIRNLDATQLRYDLELCHKYPVREPEYRFRTLDEILEEQNNLYTGDNFYTYREVISKRPIITDTIDNSNLSMNTETNESVMACATNITGSHVHTDECYEGHRHTVKPRDAFTHVHAHDWGCSKYLMSALLYGTCPNCRKELIIYQRYAYWDSSENREVVSFVYQETQCSECNYNFGYSAPGTRLELRYEYSCGYDSSELTSVDTSGGTPTYIYGQIEKGVEKEYQKSYPQEGLSQRDYYSGCYHYHEPLIIKPKYSDDGYYGYWDHEDVFQKLRTYGSDVCYVPRYIRMYVYSYHDYECLEMDWDAFKSDTRYCKRMLFQLERIGDCVYAVSKSGAYEYSVPYSELTDYGWYGCGSFKFKVVSKVRIEELTRWGDDNYLKFIVPTDGSKPSDIGIRLEIDRQYLSPICVCDYCSDKPTRKWVLDCDLEEDNKYDCDRVVTITPTHPNQNVYLGENLITTAEIVLKNGDKKTVICTTEYQTNKIVNDEMVELTYTYQLNGVPTVAKCNITVTIVKKTNTCIYGHIYNLSSDGSDPECIFCRSYVKKIEVINPSDDKMTIIVGTTLENNGVELCVTYYDNHTETITTGYEDNLDTTYVGAFKKVTIGYKGVYTSLLVKSVRKQIQCTICGLSYELYPDGTNPGCPHCLSKTPIFTGNVMEYEESHFTRDILETLYKEHIYYFTVGDQFQVTIKNKEKSLSTGNMLLYRIYGQNNKMLIYLKKHVTIHNQQMYLME